MDKSWTRETIREMSKTTKDVAKLVSRINRVMRQYGSKTCCDCGRAENIEKTERYREVQMLKIKQGILELLDRAINGERFP